MSRIEGYHPICDFVQHIRREGFLDASVLGDKASGAMLEKMVKAVVEHSILNKREDRARRGTEWSDSAYSRLYGLGEQ